jgi:orotate phosphoribosyltransferase
VGESDLDQLRERVRDIVMTRGYLRLDEPVQLRSGDWSCDFIDAKRALAAGADLRVACEAIAALLAEQGIDYDAAGGLTMGADQFAHGLAIIAGTQWFVVRKQPKGRGTNQLIEGATLGPGMRVVLLEDVVTTGASLHEAFKRVTELGVQVVAAATLVDRGDQADAFFASRGVPYLALLTYRDLGIDRVGPAATH